MYINKASKEIFTKGYIRVAEHLMAYLPTVVLVNNFENIENIYNKFPLELRKDPCILNRFYVHIIKLILL